MSEPLFNIVFFGILQPGKDKAVVMQNMAKMFKTEPAKLAPFFAGGRKVIKSNVDELIAEKYRVALENIGLVIKIEEATAQPAKTAAAPTQDAQATEAGKGDATIAEVGATLIENPVQVEPQEIGDISSISMAEVGADVIENPVEVTPQEIGDISSISMAEVGADVIENPREKEKAPIPDISELSLK